MTKVWLDLETFSPVDIRDGVYKYAENSRILLFSWAIDDEPAQCSETLPVEVWQTVGNHDTEVWAHNAMFDRTILNYNKYVIDLHKWRDTSIQARTHGLPAGLDALAKLYALRDGKIEDGRRLINLFCKPAKNGRVNNKQTHPADWEKFKEYAVRDVEVMRELHKRMPKTNYPNNACELGLWHLDQKINDRGFNVDTKLVDSVLTALAQETERIDNETANLTEGGLNNTRRRDATIDYMLEKYGILVKDLTKSSVAKLIDDEETPAEMRELLLLRQQASTASTAKYNTLKKMMNNDGRLRGSIQFCGAARTGRASGRGFQPQNLPSRGLLKSQDIDDGIKFLKMGMADLSPFPVMKLASSAIRRVLIPSKGNHLITCDLSNIEGRIAAWLAGEQWKLEAFRDFDAGTGKDLYNIAYAKAFNVDVDSVTDEQRSIGKVMELMLGYAGGAGAFVTGALGYGFDLEKLADDIYDTLPKNIILDSQVYLDHLYKNNGERYQLSDKAFLTVDTLKRMWRESNPEIALFWEKINTAVKKAIETKEPQPLGLLTVKCSKLWLSIELPSKRCLAYALPELIDDKIYYHGIGQYSRKWERIGTYHGKLFENICQATARDVLYYCMPQVEREGMKIVLHVHDELITDSPKEIKPERLSEIMTMGFDWSKGLPLAAKAKSMMAYQK